PLRLIGFNLPADPTATLTLPPTTPEGLQWATLRLADEQLTNAVPIIVSSLPEVIEGGADNHTLEKAQPVSAPCGISGCIAKEGEVDCYAFEVKAGERFSFEVVAQRHQSQLDSVLRLLN